MRSAAKGNSVSDWNDKIVAEFRANDGKVGGPFAGYELGTDRKIPVVVLDRAG